MGVVFASMRVVLLGLLSLCAALQITTPVFAPVFSSTLQVTVSSSLSAHPSSSSSSSLLSGVARVLWVAGRGLNAYRVDEQFGSSQSSVTTLVSLADRLAYVWSGSGNSTSCAVFCLPPSAGTQLPVLGVQSNNTAGSTRQLGPQLWQRTQLSAPLDSPLGLLNASVFYSASLDAAAWTPIFTAANYSYAGQQIASLGCTFLRFDTNPRFDPSQLLPPPACDAKGPARVCFAPLLPVPFPVAHGCFYAENYNPFGFPSSAKCRCS